MAFFHVLLNGTGTSGDGSTWADDSSGTAAYIGGSGLVLACAAAADGDTIYLKGTGTGTSSLQIITPNGIDSMTNPVRLIGVIAATTNLGSSIVQSDLVPGIRTGNSTRAYAQTSGNAPPSLSVTGGTSDLRLYGCYQMYGIIFSCDDNLDILPPGVGRQDAFYAEECSFTVTGSSDTIQIGDTGDSRSSILQATHCLFDAGDGAWIRVHGSTKMDFKDCDFITTTINFFGGSSGWGGIIRFIGCDLSGMNATMFDVQAMEDGIIELWGCKMPASHILITGTAVGWYSIANYGSEDNTGLDSADSEQALEIRTVPGTVDIETTVVRTGGADDGATDSGGLFSWAIVANNVTENIVGVVSPWMEKWVLGDGTSKTATVFVTNSHTSAAGNDVEDDELHMEVLFPNEAGTSMYQFLPDEGAPSDGGGKMQLLGTAADSGDDTGSTWASGGENDQKLTQSIAPDYRGLVRTRVHWSGNRGALAYDAQSANFTVGAILTGGTSGATALITADTDAGSTGTLELRSISGTFQNDETITDDNGSPGSATSNGTVTVMTLYVDPAMTVA